MTNQLDKSCIVKVPSFEGVQYPALKVYSTGVEEARMHLCMLLTPDRAAMEHLKSVESYLRNRNVTVDRKQMSEK